MPPKAQCKKKKPPPLSPAGRVVRARAKVKKKPPPPSSSSSTAADGVVILPPAKGNKKPPPLKKAGKSNNKHLTPAEKLQEWRAREGSREKTKKYNAKQYRKAQSKIPGTLHYKIATLTAQLELAHAAALPSHSNFKLAEESALYFNSHSKKKDVEAAAAKQAVAAARFQVHNDELTQEVERLTEINSNYRTTAAKDFAIVRKLNRDNDFLKKFIPGEISIPVVMKATTCVNVISPDDGDTVAEYFRVTLNKFKLDALEYKLYR